VPANAPVLCFQASSSSSSLKAAAQEPETAAVPKSACPFAGTVPDSSKPAAAPPTDLSGPGWKVLPHGNVNHLPVADGNFSWMPIIGEYGELESKGAGAFMLERFR
jgi:hypothetical protein